MKKAGLLAIMMLLAAVAGLWAWQMLSAVPGGSAPVMTVEDAHQKARAGEIILVDVRRPSEWQASGLPTPAHAITMHQDSATFVRQLRTAANGQPNRPLALICATGGRTSWLLPQLRKAGFTNLINVAEGMFGSSHGPGWLKKRLPVRPWNGPKSQQP